MAESLAAHEVPLVGDFSVSAPNPDFADSRIAVIKCAGDSNNADAPMHKVGVWWRNGRGSNKCNFECMHRLRHARSTQGPRRVQLLQ